MCHCRTGLDESCPFVHSKRVAVPQLRAFCHTPSPSWNHNRGSGRSFPGRSSFSSSLKHKRQTFRSSMGAFLAPRVLGRRGGDDGGT
jgi:hypothetical protein